MVLVFERNAVIWGHAFKDYKYRNDYKRRAEIWSVRKVTWVCEYKRWQCARLVLMEQQKALLEPTLPLWRPPGPTSGSAVVVAELCHPPTCWLRLEDRHDEEVLKTHQRPRHTRKEGTKLTSYVIILVMTTISTKTCNGYVYQHSPSLPANIALYRRSLRIKGSETGQGIR